jgi:hypothetical protein
MLSSDAIGGVRAHAYHRPPTHERCFVDAKAPSVSFDDLGQGSALLHSTGEMPLCIRAVVEREGFREDLWVCGRSSVGRLVRLIPLTPRAQNSTRRRMKKRV